MAQALQSDLGIEVKSSDPERLRQELNFARRGAREYGNDDFNLLVFRSCPSDPENYVWIVRKISYADQPPADEPESSTED